MKKLLTPVAVAVSLAAGSLAAPTIASAELSANFGLSNMYLWRGQNLTPDGGFINGGLQYDTEVGLYGGVWAGSEEGGHETDLYVGFGGEVGDTGFSYDVSYWKYLYPEEGTDVDLGDSDYSEWVIGLGFGGFSFTAYLEAEDDFADDNYYTIGYSYDAFSATYGWWDLDAAGANEYSHITLGYAYNDNLSFAVSFADNDVGTSVEEDPLFQATYSFSF